jgi:uncharacterized C2H2 Zn-finger protein
MPKYLVVCPSCNSEFLSYEEYISHVFEKHEDQTFSQNASKNHKERYQRNLAARGIVNFSTEKR